MEGNLNLSMFKKPQVKLTASSHEACLGFTLLNDLDEFLLEKLLGKIKKKEPTTINRQKQRQHSDCGLFCVKLFFLGL